MSTTSSLICQWTFRLLSCLGYCKVYYSEHWGACIFWDHIVPQIYAMDHRVTNIPIQSGITGSHVHILPHILFHYGLSQDIEYSSLSYTIGPCCLSTQSDFRSYCYRSRTILFLMKGFIRNLILF